MQACRLQFFTTQGALLSFLHRQRHFRYYKGKLLTFSKQLYFTNPRRA